MSSFRTSDQIRYGTFQKSSNIQAEETLLFLYLVSSMKKTAFAV